jgi:hypothetical protein
MIGGMKFLEHLAVLFFKRLSTSTGAQSRLQRGTTRNQVPAAAGKLPVERLREQPLALLLVVLLPALRSALRPGL